MEVGGELLVVGFLLSAKTGAKTFQPSSLPVAIGLGWIVGGIGGIGVKAV